LPYLLVYNPKSGRGKAKKVAETLKFEIEALGEACKLITGSSREDALRNLISSVTSCKAIVAVGGDGLVNLVISATIEKNVPIFVVAAGTGNDFHREHFKLRRSLVETIASRSSNTFLADLAKVEVSDEIKLYGQVLSAGFDSLVNARANSLKFFNGTIKYVMALLLELPKFKPYLYQMNIDGKIRKFEAMMVIVANGPTYGGGMKILPMANPADGLLDVMILHQVSKFELLRVFPKVFSGKHISHKQVEVMRCKNISIQSDAYVYADGEYFGKGNFSVSILPKALKMLGN
jgi:diacylglycerol kinase (ATP)